MARKEAVDEVVRITTAAGSRADDIRARQKRYLMSMSLRTLCFVGAIIASLAGIGWLWPILIVGALVLPYIAVVMANDRPPKKKLDVNRYKVPAPDRILESRPSAGRVIDG